jgi:iron complex transport system permease protein
VKPPLVLKRLLTVSIVLFLLLLAAMLLGLSVGSTGSSLTATLQALWGKNRIDPTLSAIIWRIRLPRVLLAALVGATLSVGGLVFQALLRNPLAEPYILGISGGSAIGAIIGILLGVSPFPGVSLFAFIGSMATLLLILMMVSGQTILKKESLLLSGVMVNAFCAAVIMFLVSLTRDSRLHNIIFWLMGDFSMVDARQVAILGATLLPGLILIFCFAHPMNLLLTGKEQAQSMGVHVKAVTVTLLVTTSFMVSATVSHSGLLGFVGLVMPHLLRLLLGPDHRVLVPACILGGSTYMVLCDILARILPEQGEMPVGVITAMIGAPLFIFLMKTSKR